MTVTRQDIADALTGSEVVTGYQFRPTVLGSGVAWAQPASHDRADGFFMTTWSIYVICYQDESTAAAWYDANIQALRDALHIAVYVDRDEPVVMSADDGDFFSILITARSE